MKKIIVTLAMVLLFTTVKVFSQDLTPQEVFKMCSSSVVDIYTYDYQDEEWISGSGVVIEPGIIATNFHVLSEAKKYEIKKDSVSLGFAKLIAANESRDIAILSLDSLELPVVKLGNCDNFIVGENVYTIGSPFELSNSFSNGIISGLKRNFDIMYSDMLQFSAIVSPGSSGGALFNSKGELIGITTLGYDTYPGLNFAIPISYYEDVLSNRNYYSVDTLTIDLRFRMINSFVYEEYSQVEDVCSELLEINKFYPEAYYYRGYARYKSIEYKSSLEDYNKLMEICPEKNWLYYDTTTTKGKVLNTYSNLITGYTNDLKQNKSDRELYLKRGIVYFLMQNYIAASRDFSEQLKLNASDYEAYYYRGVSYLHLKYKKDGINDLHKALELLSAQNENPELKSTIEKILEFGININYEEEYTRADGDERPKGAIEK
ncbi:trypsin-like peptidase domain-containing protein [Bacteroidota bacterium]